MLSFFHKLHWNEKLKAHSILLENIDIQKVNYILKLHVWFHMSKYDWMKCCWIPSEMMSNSVSFHSVFKVDSPSSTFPLAKWKSDFEPAFKLLDSTGTLWHSITIISSHTIWNNKLLNKLASSVDAIAISNLKLSMTHPLTNSLTSNYCI